MKRKLLFVEDNKNQIDSFIPILEREGFDVYWAGTRVEALKVWNENWDLKLAVIDLKLPDRNEEFRSKESGLFLISELSKRQGSAITAYTNYTDHNYLSKVVEANAYGFISKTWDVKKTIHAIRICELWTQANSSINAFKKSLEMRSPYTFGHCDRVVSYVRKIIPLLPTNVTGDNFDLASCLVAASVHDLGKINMHENILNGTQYGLSIDERKHVEQHVLIGEKTLEELGEIFAYAAKVVRYHHRWYNAEENEISDYPKYGKERDSASPRGEKIPIESRVISAADCLDAMLSDRSYRPGLELKIAKKEFERGKGKQFCPIVTDAVLRLNDEEISQIVSEGTIKDEAEISIFIEDKRLTSRRTIAILNTLSNIYLSNGTAIDVLSVKKILNPDRNTPNEIVLQGSNEDIQETYEILKEKIKDNCIFNEILKSGKSIPKYFLSNIFNITFLRIEKRNSYGTENYPSLE